VYGHGRYSQASSGFFKEFPVRPLGTTDQVQSKKLHSEPGSQEPYKYKDIFAQIRTTQYTVSMQKVADKNSISETETLDLPVLALIQICRKG
jgi:hypothetical protein